MAILKHSASTDEHPQHEFCPPGEESWCKWQVDRTLGTSTYRHTHPLHAAVADVVKPLFERLSETTLLEGTKDCLTQNPNESLHHLIWDKCPKSSFSGLRCVEIAVQLGVLEFNCGRRSYLNVLQEMNIEPGHHAEAFSKQDNHRLYFASVKSSSAAKTSRAKRRATKRSSEDRLENTDGPMYESGAFIPNSTDTPSPPKKARAAPCCRKCGKLMKGHRRGQPRP